MKITYKCAGCGVTADVASPGNSDPCFPMVYAACPPAGWKHSFTLSVRSKATGTPLHVTLHWCAACGDNRGDLRNKGIIDAGTWLENALRDVEAVIWPSPTAIIEGDDV